MALGGHFMITSIACAVSGPTISGYDHGLGGFLLTEA